MEKFVINFGTEDYFEEFLAKPEHQIWKLNRYSTAYIEDEFVVYFWEPNACIETDVWGFDQILDAEWSWVD